MIKGIRQQARRRSSGRAFGNSTKPKLVVCALCAMLFGLCLPAQAQGPGKIPKIGFLGAGVVSRPWHESFQREFQKLGYVDGKNVIFIHRFAETNYERLPALADELVRLKVDVIITPGSNDTRAANRSPYRAVRAFANGVSFSLPETTIRVLQAAAHEASMKYPTAGAPTRAPAATTTRTATRC